VAGERIAVILLAATALALRLPNLGRLGLVADEGHQALAVTGILEHGVPQVPSGNIYLRGAPFLYAEAASVKLLGLSEWSLRLPAAIFGALTVVLVFVYGRMLFGTFTGLIAAFLLAFSLWELELSRYARMYTLFQFGFLAAAIAFYRGYVEGRKGWRPIALALMVLTVTTHELGLFVALLFLIPAFLPNEILPGDLRGRGRWRLLVPALALCLFWNSYQRFEERLLTRTTQRHIGASDAAETFLDRPGTPLSLLANHLLVPDITLPLDIRDRDRPAALLALGLTLVPGVVAAGSLLTPGRRFRTGWALAILGAGLLNQFGVAVALVAGYLILLPGGLGELKRRPLFPVLLGTAALGLYWSGYLALNPTALMTPWGESRSVAQAFFGFPPIGKRVVQWFADGWPAMSAVSAVTLAVLLGRFALDRRQRASLFAAGVVLLPLVGVTMVREIYNESRYHFHLYPFLLVVFALALGWIARFLTGTADTLAAIAGRRFPVRRLVDALLVVVMALVLSPEVAPGEIANILQRDYATRKDPIRSIINWRPYAFFHQDHKGPAQWVRARLTPEDRIMVIGPTYWSSIYLHYIGRVDYAVSEKVERLYRDGVVVHYVSGVRCLTSLDELDQALAAESGRRLWILGDLNLLSDEAWYFSSGMKVRLREIAVPQAFLGRDSNTFVACYPPARRSPANP
jgi:4-amino-4-deoxy-L-arabinose transferase-like glycosyltransferase